MNQAATIKKITNPNIVKDFYERIHFDPDTLRRTNTGWYHTHWWPALAFSHGALVELSHIVGLVNGLRLAEKRVEAERVHADIIERLDYLNGYGDDRFKVAISSDNWNPMNFGVAWYGRASDSQLAKLKEDGGYHDPAHHPWTDQRYVYAFNGGLIAHGFGQENATVLLGNSNNIWNIHT